MNDILDVLFAKYINYKNVVIFLLILLIYSSAVFLFSSNGLLSYWNMHENINRQKAINKDLQAKVQELQYQIKHIHNKQAMETFARRDLGMMRNDETMYRFIISEDITTKK